jgi:hypothetical protein
MDIRPSTIVVADPLGRLSNGPVAASTPANDNSPASIARRRAGNRAGWNSPSVMRR